MNGFTLGPSGHAADVATEVARLENLVTFYREAYEKIRARAEALEKSNTRLYEQAALHTEESGMQRQEIRRLRDLLEAKK